MKPFLIGVAALLGICLLISIASYATYRFYDVNAYTKPEVQRSIMQGWYNFIRGDTTFTFNPLANQRIDAEMRKDPVAFMKREWIAQPYGSIYRDQLNAVYVWLMSFFGTFILLAIFTIMIVLIGSDGFSDPFERSTPSTVSKSSDNGDFYGSYQPTQATVAGDWKAMTLADRINQSQSDWSRSVQHISAENQKATTLGHPVPEWKRNIENPPRRASSLVNADSRDGEMRVSNAPAHHPGLSDNGASDHPGLGGDPNGGQTGIPDGFSDSDSFSSYT